MDKLCAYVLRLCLSPLCLSLYVLVCILYSFHSIKYIYDQPRSPRGCWPAGYLSGSVRDTLFPVRRSGRHRAGGVINHRPLCSMEYENIVPGGTATWRILLFSLFCGIRHLQLTLFFEPLLLRDIPLGTFSTPERELICKSICKL